MHRQVTSPFLAASQTAPARSSAAARRPLRRYTDSAATDPAQQEREHLAQFLHDQVGGLLVQLRLAYGAWRQLAPPAGPADASAAFDALLAELSGTVRRLTFAMAPPDWHDGLMPALESLAADLGLRSGLTVHLAGTSLLAVGPAAVPAAQRAVACRVVRELGLNALKHARASCLHIRASVAGGQLVISVQDDGQGLPADAAQRPTDGLGLRSARAQLRALGGSLMLRSAPGAGTCATLTLPLPPA